MGQAANKARKARAVKMATDLVLGGKAKYEISKLPDEVIQESMRRIKKSGDLLGNYKLHEALKAEWLKRTK